VPAPIAAPTSPRELAVPCILYAHLPVSDSCDMPIANADCPPYVPPAIVTIPRPDKRELSKYENWRRISVRLWIPNDRNIGCRFLTARFRFNVVMRSCLEKRQVEFERRG
jgi:hypothetical protein